MTPGQADLRALTRLAEGVFAGPPLHPGRGPIPANRHGDGNDFLEFAEYRDGDDVRLIDWRATARHVRPMVRRNRARAASRWTVLVDCSASMRFGQRWACASDLAAAFAAILLHQSHRVGLVLFDTRVRVSVPARSGMSHLDQITAALDEPPSRPDGSVGSLFCALRSLVRPTGVVVLSDLLWGERTDAALRACQTLGGRAHILRLAAPEDIAASPGAVAVADAETGQIRRLIGSGQDRTATARRNLDALDARAARASRAAGAIYSSAPVEAGWKSAIVNHLGRAARAHA